MGTCRVCGDDELKCDCFEKEVMKILHGEEGE